MKCPKCGSKKIIISEKLEYVQYWFIEENKLYKKLGKMASSGSKTT